MGTFDEILVNQRMSFLLLSVENQLANLIQVSLRLCAVVVVGRAAPEGLLVKLYLFCAGAAVNHGTQMAVTNRQSLQPMCGGLAVP